jgi:sialate O-acetylesterase
MKHPKLLIFALTSVLLLVAVQPALAKVSVPSLIGDNMVLQAGKQIRIWGSAEPRESVTVELANKKDSAIADDHGRWQVLLGPLKPGGPFVLTIRGSNVLSFNNVLVGEVWVCSGQSNMEWPLVNTNGAAAVIAQTKLPEVRLFTVPKKTSAAPLDNVEGHWVVGSPEEVGQFSAVAYYFGRELNQQLKIPVGLIHTSWGGTPAEAWTSRQALTTTPELQPIMERYELGLKDMPERQRLFNEQLSAWVKRNLYTDDGNKGESMGYADPKTSIADWPQMSLPQFFETSGLRIDGAVWVRKEVEVPPSWVGHPLVLSLAAIDDYDTTYFNGQRVGGIGPDTPNSYTVQRRYQIPASLVQNGRNVIAVRVFDSAGEGGFGAGEMALNLAGNSAAGIPLNGNWGYKVESGLTPKSPDWGSRPEAPGPDNQNSPGVLYNAMLAPLTPYTVRGAIWYQGESNAGRAHQYRTLFPTMIRSWRAAWADKDYPFYFVQLANWQPMKPEPGESEWAELREAQTLTLQEPKTGMAVTIDIGEANDIHPRNKLDVGHRLAVWALAKTYDRSIEFSGPLFKSLSIEGNQIRLKFEHASGLKTLDGGPVKGFAIAGEDRRFVWAEARVEGNDIVVASKEIKKPVAVRYGWADNPVANLYNKAGFPASPFRTDSWPGVTIDKK